MILPGLCPLYQLWHNELVTALKRGFPLSFKLMLDGKNPVLHLNERCIQMQKHVYFDCNQEFARE